MQVTRFALDEARIWVAGHRGMVGSAIWRALEADGVGQLIGWPSTAVDLTDRDATLHAAREARPDVVVVAAAKVGGIGANAAEPVEFLRDNVRIQTNVMEAAHAVGVDRLLFLGSSCIYPRLAPQPITSSALLSGPLEPTNDAYAIAKIAGVLHVQGYRRQYGVRWISAMPTNLYGPRDNFDLSSAHVLPAMIHRFEVARHSSVKVVELWGTGQPRREFLHVDDLARACLTLLKNYDDSEPINIGTGTDVSIAELAGIVANAVGFKGLIRWNPSKPDGVPRKLLDVRPILDLGWSPRIELGNGVRDTHKWFVRNKLENTDVAVDTANAPYA